MVLPAGGGVADPPQTPEHLPPGLQLQSQRLDKLREGEVRIPAAVLCDCDGREEDCRAVRPATALFCKTFQTFCYSAPAAAQVTLAAESKVFRSCRPSPVTEQNQLKQIFPTVIQYCEYFLAHRSCLGTTLPVLFMVAELGWHSRRRLVELVSNWPQIPHLATQCIQSLLS